MHTVDKYIGLVLVGVIFYYLFKDANGTSSILNSLSKFNVSAISALQGRAGGY